MCTQVRCVSAGQLATSRRWRRHQSPPAIAAATTAAPTPEPTAIAQAPDECDSVAEAELGPGPVVPSSGCLGLPLAPGMPTTTSSETAFPAVHDEWPPATSRQVLPVT